MVCDTFLVLATAVNLINQMDLLMTHNTVQHGKGLATCN